jgi:hypothetical protein
MGQWAGRFLFTGILASNRYHSDIAICFFRSSAPKSIVIARVPPCPPRACGCERILSVVHSKHDTSGQWRRISAPRRQKAGAQMWIGVAYGQEHTTKTTNTRITSIFSVFTTYFPYSLDGAFSIYVCFYFVCLHRISLVFCTVVLHHIRRPGPCARLSLWCGGRLQRLNSLKIATMQHLSYCDGSAIFRISSKNLPIYTNSYQNPMQFELFQTRSTF